MTNPLPMLITPTSITVIFEKASHTILASDASRFFRLRTLLSTTKGTLSPDDAIALRSILSTDLNDSSSFSKNFIFRDGAVYHLDSGEEHLLPPVLSDRIYELYQSNQDFDYFLKFYNLLKKNPSNRAIQEFYKFLEHRNLPIDPDGYVYAYKAIRPNFYDIHSGKFFNGVGRILEMPRNKVDDDANRHCSHGFHVGSLEYVRWYGRADSKFVICRFSPEDVVSVPNDHSCQKVRVCRYEVVAEYTGPLPSTYVGCSNPEEENFGELNLQDESWIEDFNTDYETSEEEEDDEAMEESHDSSAHTIEAWAASVSLQELIESFGVSAVTTYLNSR